MNIYWKHFAQSCSQTTRQTDSGNDINWSFDGVDKSELSEYTADNGWYLYWVTYQHRLSDISCIESPISIDGDAKLLLPLKQTCVLAKFFKNLFFAFVLWNVADEETNIGNGYVDS